MSVHNKPTRHQFSQEHDFQRRLLRDRPHWWRAILRIISRQRNFNTNAWNGSYAGLIAALALEGVEVTLEGVRYALRELEHLGLIGRDHTGNAKVRRLVIVLRVSLAASLESIIRAARDLVQKLSNRCSNRPLAGVPGAPSNRCSNSSIQMASPLQTSQCEQPKTTEGAAVGRAALAALRLRINQGLA